MKIPQILAQTDAPASMPAGQGAGIEYVGAQGRAIARGLDQLGAAALDIGALERQKQMRAAHQEAGMLSSQADMEMAALGENMKLVTGDPDEYKAKMQEGLTGISNRTMQATKNEQTKAILQGQLLKIGGRHGQQALVYSNDLFKGQQVGRMKSELANRAVTASLLDPTDDRGWVEQFQAGVAAIDNASPFLRGKRDEVIREWRGDLAKERAYRTVKADPTANVEAYRPLMSPEQWKWVEGRQDHFQDVATGERERIQKETEVAAEKARVFKQVQLHQLLADPAISNKETLIDQAVQVGIIMKPSELSDAKALLKPREMPSDPIEYQRLSSMVFHPDATSRGVIKEIQRSMAVHNQGGKGLDAKDGTRLLQHASSEIQREEKEAYTIAMNEGLTALGIPPFGAAWDKTQKKLASQFTQMMNATAKPANPQGVGAREALNQALPVLQQIQDQDTRLDFNDQWKIIAPWAKTPQPDPLDMKAYEAWHGEQVAAIEALKAENPAKNGGLYHVRRRQLEDLLSAAKAQAEAAARRGGKTSNKSGSSGREVGGYKPPGG